MLRMESERIIASFLFVAALIVSNSAADPCYDYDHEEYGMIGNCIPTTACASGGGEMIAGICPSFDEDHICCFNENFPGREMRGAWIATVTNIDWPESPADSVPQQQADLTHLIDRIADAGLNAIYFQVRPVGDALYASNIEPWSRYLTGTQGTAPNPLWDPLEFVIDYAHGKNMEVHAWINPYRASMSNMVEDLADNHMVNLFPEYAYVYDTFLWMDPGSEEVQNRTSEVSMDIVRRYDVDGLHMDDYFYPYPVEGVEFPDSNTYNRYIENGGTLSLDDWRRDNVNKLIKRLNSEIHAIKSWVKFSVSPFGIYRACQEGGMPCSITGFDQYAEIYCDAKLWLEMGWVDVLIPQLYWRIEPPAQSYPVLLDWWVEQNILDRHFFAGNYLSRIELQDWPLEEIREQVMISRSQTNRARGSWGNVMFSAYIFGDNVKDAVTYFAENIYQYPALQPPVTWLAENTTKANSPKLEHTKAGVQLEVNDTNHRNIIIYQKLKDTWFIYQIIAGNTGFISDLPANSTFALSSIDRYGQESKRQIFYT